MTSQEWGKRMSASVKMKSLVAWFNERFPAVNFLSGLIMYLMIAGVSQSLLVMPLKENWLFHLLGAVVLTSMFLLLRVIDEHKDYKTDCLNHPERVLQSGRISLNDLKVVGLFCVILQVVYAVWVDQGIGMTFASYLLVLAWALLMAKEFFVGDWLKKNLLLYALSHMMIASITVVWILSAFRAEGNHLKWLITLPFLAGMVYEIARKLRGSEEERKTVDSYSQILGHRKAGALLLFFATAALANYALLLNETFLAPWSGSFVSAVVCGALLIFGVAAYSKANNKKSRKLVEGLAGLYILAMYSLLIYESVRVS